MCGTCEEGPLLKAEAAALVHVEVVKHIPDQVADLLRPAPPPPRAHKWLVRLQDPVSHGRGGGAGSRGSRHQDLPPTGNKEQTACARRGGHALITSRAVAAEAIAVPAR